MAAAILRSILIRSVAVGAFLFVLAAPARADPGGLVVPPTDLQGTYDSTTGQLLLTWVAPDAGAYTYHVYRDEKEVGQTTTTSYIETPLNDVLTAAGALYTVRATPVGMTLQGPPSTPYYYSGVSAMTAVDSTLAMVQNATVANWPVHTEILLFMGDPCSPIIPGNNPDPPYVAHIDENCLDGLLHP